MTTRTLGVGLCLLSACGGSSAGDAGADAHTPADAFVETDAFVPPADAGMDAFVPPDSSGCGAIGSAYAILEWTDIVTTPGCNTFSGPLGVGVEYSLGERGTVTGTTTLEIDGSTFTATDVGYARARQCPYGSGGQYRFDERFEGAWEGGWPSDPSCASSAPV